jgi:hypothetical protein
VVQKAEGWYAIAGRRNSGLVGAKLARDPDNPVNKGIGWSAAVASKLCSTGMKVLQWIFMGAASRCPLATFLIQVRKLFSKCLKIIP